jgi:peptidoglycan glycosyltransferase
MSIRSRLRRLTPLLFVLAVLLSLLYFVVGLPLRTARNSWREGRYTDAAQILESWRRLRIRPADYDNLLAVTYLTAGRDDEARPLLQRLARRRMEWRPIIRKDEVGSRMISAGRYAEYLEYDDAYRYRGESDNVRLYRAAAQLGSGRAAEADTTFATIDPSDVDPKKLAALRAGLEERKKGSYSLVLDRGGKTIGSYQVDNRDLVAINHDFAAVIEKEAGKFTFESALSKLGTVNTIHTTLDPQVQKAAISALGGLRGSLVAIDVTTNEILAIASTAGRGEVRNLAFEAFYEPGSIIKVLTEISALDNGIDVAAMFPMECGGFLILSGRQFFDWAKHGSLDNIHEALAVSCNVAFGKVGMAVGRDRLMAFMKKAGFDGNADLGVWRVPLGKHAGELPLNDYAIAHYAIGLEYERINSLHVAMLASMLANHGRMAVPRLVRARQTILGEPVGDVPPLRSELIVADSVVRAVLPSMRAVVENPRGSGRRAAIPGIPIAMKTGTAGEGKGGYDALIMAFAPADSPRIAIGVIAEDAGPAEFAGAKVAHDFFEQVRSHLK